MANAHAQSDHGHHVVSNKVLNSTFLQLFVAMVLTIAAARAPIDGPKYFPGFDNLFKQWEFAWPLTNAIALGIAIFKAVQVIRYFMGVQYASRLAQLFAVGGFLGFSLLYITFIDYWSRPWEPVRGWERVPSTAFPRDFRNEAGQAYPSFPGKEGHGEATKEEQVEHGSQSPPSSTHE